MLWHRISGLHPFDSVLEEGEPAKGGGTSTTDIEVTVRKLLDAKGDQAAVSELLKDNFKQREEIRLLTEKLAAAPKVGEGALVLKPEEAKQWKAYQELGKPEDLKKSLDSKVELEKKVQDGERKEAIAAAADAAGYKASVLVDLKGSDTLKFEVREETVDGQKVKVAYVTEAKQGATPKKLTDYAQEAWKDHLPSLEAEATTEERKPSGTEFVRQKPAGNPPKKGPVTVADVTEAKRGTRAYQL